MTVFLTLASSVCQELAQYDDHPADIVEFFLNDLKSVFGSKEEKII